ncbi:MAG: polyphenol oxidase family protein [Candidatus Peribacteraceae bacterium]|nr:polyphenol oxidase family protein [Candidatus Peribacteraceae bacterium]
MLENPFPLFEQFAHRLRVTIFRREDAFSDAAALRHFDGAGGASLWQVHGGESIVVRQPTERAEKADGIATDTTGLVLSIRWADCQNFVIYAPNQHVVGILHAGWRGLAADALANHYALLKEKWGILPEETYIGAGPSLCTACAEFSDPAHELPSADPQFFHGKHVDLRGIADAQLDAIGVPRIQRERIENCTCCCPNEYWTYRGGDRESVLSGRTNALACMLLA